MCGIAGYSGIQAPLHVRATLLHGLACGIDARGKDAWGYAGHTGERTIASKGLGKWSRAPFQQVMRASTAVTVALHSRWATHGSKEARENAHPFTIKRDSKIVLHGMHNGVLQGTEESAKKYGRPFSVDSRELYELLADGKIDEVESGLTGYGLLAWALPGDPMLRLLKMTKDADLYMVVLDAGGIVYGSTKSIVEAAIHNADLGKWVEHADYKREGLVMGLQDGTLYDTNEQGFTLKRASVKAWDSFGGYTGYTGTKGTALAGGGTQGKLTTWTNKVSGEDWHKCVDGHWRKSGETYPVRHSVTYSGNKALPMVPKKGGKGSYTPRPQDEGTVWRWLKKGSDKNWTIDWILQWNDKDVGWYHHCRTSGSDRITRAYTEYHPHMLCDHGVAPNVRCDVCDGEEASSRPAVTEEPPPTIKDSEKSPKPAHSEGCNLHLGTDPDCEACWDEAVSDIINRNQFAG